MTKGDELPTSSLIVVIALVVITAISALLVDDTNAHTTAHVWLYGWSTALSTGLGTVPFFLLTLVSSTWLCVANAVAAGMMLAASWVLLFEGMDEEPSRVYAGFFFGIVFLHLSKVIMGDSEAMSIGALKGADGKKALLVMAVMTLHSFAEGVGIGVSFGSLDGKQLGTFISLTLAIHNVPEGMALSLALIPRGVCPLDAMLLSVGSSIPQPFMAVLAYYFVEQFSMVLPVGLGFAAGAMSYVTFMELIPESLESLSLKSSGFIVGGAAALMIFTQHALLDASPT